jgi:predicted carbohydrate-binding protein with CBM5 and CBM33 domain
VRFMQHLRLRHRLVLAAATAVLAAGAGALVAAQPAQAHGTMLIPGSRTWLCYQDALQPNGQLTANNPACAAALAKSGTTSLYNWFAVLRSDGNGRTRGFIPDGKLCSGNAVVYDFSGYDLGRSDWPVTHLTSGATMAFHYNKWAAHPGWFYLYVTKDGWDQNAPLTWDALEQTPFSSADHPPSVGDPGTNTSYYYWNATLPQNKTGHHIIYSVWQRSDSQETFYGCSDVVFDGGNGQVTGVGPGQSTSPTPSTSPSRSVSPSPSQSRSVSPSPSVSTSPSRSVSPSPSTGGSGCTATYAISSTWSGAFQAGITITNKGSTPTAGWTVGWTFTAGETISSLWNGTATTSGSSVSVANVSYNGTITGGGTTQLGFLGNGTPATTVSNLTCTAR